MRENWKRVLKALPLPEDRGGMKLYVKAIGPWKVIRLCQIRKWALWYMVISPFLGCRRIMTWCYSDV